jgi:hypothetical protein
MTPGQDKYACESRCVCRLALNVGGISETCCHDMFEMQGHILLRQRAEFSDPLPSVAVVLKHMPLSLCLKSSCLAVLGHNAWPPSGSIVKE